MVGPFFDEIFFGVPFVPSGLLASAITFVGSADYVPSILYRATVSRSDFFAFNFGLLRAGQRVTGTGSERLWRPGVLFGQLIAGAIVLVIVVDHRHGAERASLVLGGRRTRAPLRRAARPPSDLHLTLRLSDRWLLGLLLAIPLVGQRYRRSALLGGLPAWQPPVSIVAMSFNAAWTPYFYRIADEPQGLDIYRHIITITSAGFLWMASYRRRRPARSYR